MKKILIFIIILIGAIGFYYFNNNPTSAALVEMTDSEYPDNPNIESRHTKAQLKLFNNVAFTKTKNDFYDVKIESVVKGFCEITLHDVPLLEFMPTIPEYIKKDEYLSFVGVLNQEWNRQQVQFNKENFTVKGNPNFEITRVDLARNCLNSYLWEIIIYAKDIDGKEKVYWQSWFNFPKKMYQSLFLQRNNVPFYKYASSLENWVDPQSETINLKLLRKSINEKVVKFESRNNEMYPLQGERMRKRKNIIYPKTVTKMSDLLTDSTKFATFSIPGYYNKLDPRSTQLSKLRIVKKVTKRNIINALNKPALEIEIEFLSNVDNKTITKLLFGGIDFKEIPKAAEQNANNCWQTSMGIANHSFYETIDFQQKHLTIDNPFYAFLLDENNKWLDSHKIGIDGPMLHFDEKDPNKLHLWILSFERHAFVGHYIIEI
jgi:hypothetical protein